VFELPVTDALNCCVLPNATVAVAGVAETATVDDGVCVDELAQPHKKTETQPRANDDAQRMEILTGGPGAHSQKQGIKRGQQPKEFTH
jgi:hypothetical protein